MRWLWRVADNRDPDSLASRMRRRRFAWLLERLGNLASPATILDVGGTEAFWRGMGELPAGSVEVTLVNLAAEPVTLPFLRSVAGDARWLSQFHDRQFDVVFSNSVIEHLGLFRDQILMANEVRRVGRRYFVQTPNRFFPIEPHTLSPMMQFVPRRAMARLLQRRRLGWMDRVPDPAAALIEAESLRLLDRRELRLLFPDAEILEERIGPLTKSFVAVGGWS